MESSSGTTSSSESEKKRKRKISNRESARRSRMKKQKLLEDLTAQVTQLKKENNEIMTSVSITTQHYITIEAENSVLRAQLEELNHRLESLYDIINFLDKNEICSNPLVGLEFDDFFVNQTCFI